MAGKTFAEALRNLNAMHGHLRIAHFHSMFMPNIRATMEVRIFPSFPQHFLPKLTATVMRKSLFSSLAGRAARQDSVHCWKGLA